MRYLTVPFLVLAAFGCDTASSDRVAKLEARIAELEKKTDGLPYTVEQIRMESEASARTLTQAAAAIAWADTVRPYVSIDSHNDVTIINANLRLQGGTSWNEAPFEGKSNLIFGYDRDYTEGTCSSGPYPGRVCQYDEECGGDGGTCVDIQVLSEKTGNYNIIMSDEATYTANHSLVMGYRNSSKGGSSIVNGTENVVEAPYGSILGGEHNHVLFHSTDESFGTIINGHGNTAQKCVILGGSNNQCDTTDTTILGGQNVTDGDNPQYYQILP